LFVAWSLSGIVSDRGVRHRLDRPVMLTSVEAMVFHMYGSRVSATPGPGTFPEYERRSWAFGIADDAWAEPGGTPARSRQLPAPEGHPRPRPPPLDIPSRTGITRDKSQTKGLWRVERPVSCRPGRKVMRLHGLCSGKDRPWRLVFAVALSALPLALGAA